MGNRLVGWLFHSFKGNRDFIYYKKFPFLERKHTSPTHNVLEYPENQTSNPR